MAEPCGCFVGHHIVTNEHVIHHCPLHAAAPETATDLDSLLKDYDKLKELEAALREIAGEGGHVYCTDAMRIARRALGGEEG